MIIYNGEKLGRHLVNSLAVKLKKRFIENTLDEYVDGPNNGKVCCLYGLWRTGKTIMMLQEIKRINDYSRCLLIECESDESSKIYDTMGQVRKAIDEHSDCKYIFIDEITKTKNFIATCSFLANQYACSGRKVIIAGTDTLGFFLAKNDELYDRMQMIHTTYIPYREYHYLLGRDIVSYIKYGGTLTDGEVFYNNDRLKEYSNSAICYNITHSLEKWNQGRNNGVLEDIIAHNELPSFINKVIEHYNRSFLAKTIFLDIKEDTFNTVDYECVEIITQYLKDLDVLWQLPKVNNCDGYIFTQPGMRYCQVKAFADALITSDVFNEYSDVERNNILKKVDTDICGRMLEDIVLYQIAKEYDKEGILITKYRNESGQKIDVLIENLDKLTAVAIEVNFSEVYSKEQIKQLIDNKFCNEIEHKSGTKIISRVVLYRGSSCKCPDGDVLYMNVEDFLSNTSKYLDEPKASLVETYPVSEIRNL
jgi:predicted AAA+ superfamily ATPase